MAIDEQAIAAFRALAGGEWEEYDQILSTAAERGDETVLLDYGRLVGLAHVELIRRRFPEGYIYDLIRYVAAVRRRLNMHPTELDPRAMEKVFEAAIAGADVMELTKQKYTVEQLGMAAFLVMTEVYREARMDQEEVFDQFLQELLPRVEAVAMPDQLPSNLSALLAHRWPHFAGDRSDTHDAGSS